MTITAELQNHDGNFINIFGFIQDIINDHPNPKIKSNVPVLTVGSGLRWAYGINDLVGISASTEFAYGETYIRGVNGLAFIAGAEIDLDFYPRYSVPIGFIANYNITSKPEFVYVNVSFAHVLKAKLAYTKANDFSLGIEYSLMLVPMPKVEKSPSVYMIALSNRFYF